MILLPAYLTRRRPSKIGKTQAQGGVRSCCVLDICFYITTNRNCVIYAVTSRNRAFYIRYVDMGIIEIEHIQC